MKNLIIDKTDNTPIVNFDVENDMFLISGDSRPENVKLFFEPLLTWIEDYKVEIKPNRKQRTVNASFRLEYFNSSSAKYIVEIIKSINQIELINLNMVVIINWFYNAGDEDMKESGEEISSLINIRMNLIQTK